MAKNGISKREIIMQVCELDGVEYNELAWKKRTG